MKTFTLFSLYFAMLLGAHAQDFYLSFSDITTQECYDSGINITTFEGWEFYQTLDNTWDGVRDSSICINVQIDGWSEYFITTGADISRPVFVRALLGDGIALNHNSLNRITMYLPSSAYDNLDISNTSFCNNGFCNGMMMGIEIPQNPMDTTESSMRWYTNNFNSDYIDFCMPTEYFEDGNNLKEVIFKFVLNSDADEEFYLGDIYSEDMQWFVHPLDSASLVELNYSQFSYQLMNYEQNSFLVMYQDTSLYPSLLNPSFLDVYPIPNVAYQANVQLELTYETSINFQPFTYIRGGLIANSDSVRHSYSIINEGSNICMIPYFEIPLESGNSYIHHSGNFDMSEGSCLMIKPNASLVVANDSHLHYGQERKGVLALYSDCNLIIEKNASLEISCKVSLWDQTWSDEEQIVEIHLPPHTDLLFSQGAGIVNKSTDERTKIHIYLEGGKLDLSGLKSEDMKHIKLIYPESDSSNEELVLLGNPTVDEIRFSFYSNSWQEVSGTVYNMEGQLIHQFDLNAQKGENYLNTDVSNFTVGSYVIVLSGDGIDLSTVFMKTDR